jgi:hypothetical protein
VPADEYEGAGGDMPYVTVEQDPDQSPEVCVTACANEGNPGLSLTHVLFKLCNYLCYSMCIYVQGLNETLVA